MGEQDLTDPDIVDRRPVDGGEAAQEPGVEAGDDGDQVAQ